MSIGVGAPPNILHGAARLFSCNRRPHKPMIVKLMKVFIFTFLLPHIDLYSFSGLFFIEQMAVSMHDEGLVNR
jgi:hypothetical protein